MKLGTALAAVALATVAVGGVWWLAAGSSRTVPPKPDPDAVAPAENGPYPKAVVPEIEYAFGAMQVDQTLSHEFLVRNEGHSPLKLGKPATTCKCTVSKGVEAPIPPGGESKILLEWTPKSADAAFSQQATIATNDPELPTLRLVVSGRVDAVLRIEPEGTWQAGEFSGEAPVTVTGFVYSRILDDFAVTSVTAANPLVSGQAERIADAEELKRHEAKCGYRIDVTIQPGLPVGRFRENVTIRTDVAEGGRSELTCEIAGTCRGPIQFLPTPGVNWDPVRLALDLGQFPAAKGAEASVRLFVSGLKDEELKFEAVDGTVPGVEVSLRRESGGTGGARQRYLMTFRVPPGSPAVHRNKEAAKIRIRTNHPEAREMNFYVQFVATADDTP